MPKSIARTDEVTFQASLFNEEESAQEPSRSRTSKADLNKEILTDSDLIDDSIARPRKRPELDKKIRPSNPISGDTALNLENNSKSSIYKDIKLERPAFTHHSQLDPNELTPVLKHYVELKIANPQRILLYRLGDFFECFFEDAITLSRELELALTGKEAGKNIGRVPMAGIPHQTAERFCSDLIRLGYSVALCDQLEAVPAKGSLLKRDITRVLTPGTVQEGGMLSARCNNWLAAVVVVESPAKHKEFCWGLAQADVSTGEVQVMQKEGAEELQQHLAQLEASELLWSGDDISPSWCPDRVALTRVSSTPFSSPEAKFSLCQHYKLANLDGLGLQELPLALQAMGGLIRYLHDTQPLNEDNRVPLEIPEIIRNNDTLVLDAQTRRNLELTSTQRDGVLQGSLLWSIDRTLTAMGSRCLRRWIEAPLMDLIAIEQRQAVINSLVNQRPLRKAIRLLLRPMSDLERLAGLSGAGYAGARELVSIADGLERLPKLASQLKGKLDAEPPWFQALLNPHPKLKELAETISSTLVESPPLSLNEGGLILDLVDPLLDGLRNQLDDQDAWLSQQEKKERQRSGINTLRLQHHRTFGYYLSVSKAKAESVPVNWIRRQTLSNEERFITPELKEREGIIFQLRARKYQLEYELFVKLRLKVGATAALIREAARAVASLDALAGLAEVAATNNFCQPALYRGRELILNGARHPVVEELLVDTTFTPNDISLGSNTDLVVLTGPNASGKSCYLRQIGLIQIMAQIGSWVPAKSARIGITDRIFTRVGAVDDLAAGKSTFMVEMAETANILHHATSNSLVLLDEIGRGTATFDGLSIAWAVSEHLVGELRCRSVFATHYHELNALADKFSKVSNFQVLVKETGEDLIFLHKVSPGGASRSYGIEVARLAGVPRKVIKRAQHILDKLGN